MLVVEAVPTNATPVKLYRKVSMVVDVSRPTTLKVELERAYSLLRLKLVDQLTAAPPRDALEVVANGVRVGEAAPGQQLLEVFVPKGLVDLTVTSKNGLYYELRLSIDARNDTVNATAVLRRTIFSVTVRVVDFTGRKLTGVLVEATGQDVPYTASAVTVDGEAVVQVPYGIYLVCARHEWFQERCMPLDPLVSQEVSFIMSYTPAGLVAANAGLLVTVVLVAAVATALYKLRHRIIRALAPEEEVF